jgi:hypothetical protein
MAATASVGLIFDKKQNVAAISISVVTTGSGTTAIAILGVSFTICQEIIIFLFAY